MEPGSDWQKMKPRDRAKVMWRLADMLSARAEEIGRIETLDNGKPIFESQFVDTPAAAECLYYKFMIIALRQSRNSYGSNDARACDGNGKRSAVCRELSEYQSEPVGQGRVLLL